MKRIITIDLYTIKTPYVGLGEFSYNLGKEIHRQAPELGRKYDIHFKFIVPRKFIGCFGDNVEYVRANKMLRPFVRMFEKTDIFHAIHQYSFIKKLHRADCNILTVHDVNFMYEKDGAKQERYKRDFRKKLLNADYVTFISNFVKDDVENRFGKVNPNSVIYNGVTDLNPLTCDITDKPDYSNYLFHISSLQPKKNPDLLIKMMKYLPNEKLIIAGDWESKAAEELKRIMKDENITNVIQMNSVSTQAKAHLFANCKAFLFPSLCEGFGLPPIEAMKFGKPVFLSTLTSLPEVGGEMAYYWTELEPHRMAEDVERAFETKTYIDKSDQIKEWAAQFTWNKCIKEYVSLYLKLLNIEDTK